MRSFPHRPSRLAPWSRRFALFGLTVALAGVALSRWSVFPPLQSLAVLAGGLVVCAVALVLAIAAYVEIWRSGATGMIAANWGLVLSLVVLSAPAYVTARAYGLPRINDISTDLRDPPAFSRARTALDARAGYVPSESSPLTREAQRLAYREVAPVIIDAPPEEAYKLVVEAVEMMKWQIIDRSPPSARVPVGRIDAIDRTMVMRFPDDITIRVRALASETRVDIRSISRVGRHDLGANAARIRQFSDVLLQLSKGL